MFNQLIEQEKLKKNSEAAKKPRIIIVDDDSSFCSMLCDYILNECNLQTEIYTNGETFLEDYKATDDIRIIILDYQFKKNEMNGSEILKAIKKINPFALVIMVSAQDNLETAIETMRHGASDYFYKANNTVFANIIASIIKLVEILKQQQS